MLATAKTREERPREALLSWCACGQQTELSETSSFVCLGDGSQDSRAHFCCTRCTAVNGRSRTCMAHPRRSTFPTKNLFFDYVGKNFWRCPWGCWLRQGETRHACRRIKGLVKIPGFYGSYMWDEAVDKTRKRINISRVSIIGKTVCRVVPCAKGRAPKGLRILIEDVENPWAVVQIRWKSIDKVIRVQRAVVRLGTKDAYSRFFPLGPFEEGTIHEKNCRIFSVDLVSASSGSNNRSFLGQPIEFWDRICSSQCALSRYPWLPGWTAAAATLPGQKIVPTAKNDFFMPKKASYTPLSSGKFRCGSCLLEFSSLDEFISVCVPDACSQ